MVKTAGSARANSISLADEIVREETICRMIKSEYYKITTPFCPSTVLHFNLDGTYNQGKHHFIS